jgi:hypothetical protein
MTQEIINVIKDTIRACYKRNNWIDKGNIIDVMRDLDFEKFVFETFNYLAPILSENKYVNDELLNIPIADFKNAYKSASRIIESNTIIKINPAKELKLNKEPSWLNENVIEGLGWNSNKGYYTYRTRYFEYLKKEKGWKEDVLDEVKSSSLKVIKNIGNPRELNAFFTRGMVLGSVQSGKTTNFNAVINSAIDLGYQLIIVFCGTIEDLRGQTYQRISTDVIGGWETDPLIIQRTNRVFKGVSNIYNFQENEKHVNLITGPDRNGDFNSTFASQNFNPNSYNIAVCKKNVSIIKNLLLWLDQYPLAKNLPTLIIDDECDNASLNNNGNNAETNPSQINAGIRALLNMFHKKTYLGYTATPFANILQFDGSDASFSFRKGGFDYVFNCCEQDLFPEDFIQLLLPPTNYVGIKDFFDTRDPNVEIIDGLVETIPSNDIIECFPPRVFEFNKQGTDSFEPGTRASKKDDLFPTYLPNSLKEAIKCFILSIALRYSRKDEQINFPLAQNHHSMLIHISRYTTWIERTKELILDYINEIDPAIRDGVINSPIYIELERTWNKYFLTQIDFISTQLNNKNRKDPYLTKRTFQEILNFLPSAIRNISVVSIHSNSDDELKYNDINGNKYIAIGGNTLSRGFTLEGLTINYFVRGTSNADTLMQMGRWFGYRPGYLDACKLFTSREAIRRFDEASIIIEDLENKLDEMIKEGKSPREFTIWVRDNPDVIRLTRPNLMRNLHELTLDFNDKLQQSTQFLINKNKINLYYTNFKNFIKSINTDWQLDGSFIVKKNITADKVIESLNIVGLKEVLLNFNIAGLDNFIKEANKNHLLTNWTIAISINLNGENQSISLKNEFAIDLYPDAKLIRRSRGKDKRSIDTLLNENIFKAIKSNIISPSDLGLLFSKERNDQIKDTFLKNNPDTISVPESAYRDHYNENQGLVIFYLIDPKYIIDRGDLSYEYDVLYNEFVTKNDLFDFDTPIVGCAVGLPKIKSIQTSNYVTRRIIKLPSEMSYSDLIKNSGEFGIQVDSFQNIEDLVLFKDNLNLNIELVNDITLVQLKKIILIEYLENLNNE